jgi:hypothetical protein
MASTRFRRSFDFLREFHAYRTTYPDAGGYVHDLRKWSIDRRQLYAIDNSDHIESDVNFWCRM